MTASLPLLNKRFKRNSGGLLFFSASRSRSFSAANLFFSISLTPFLFSLFSFLFFSFFLDHISPVFSNFSATFLQSIFCTRSAQVKNIARVYLGISSFSCNSDSHNSRPTNQPTDFLTNRRTETVEYIKSRD